MPEHYYINFRFQISVRMGKKKNRNALSPNAEGVRRGAVGAENRAPKARGVSMELSKSARSSPVGPGGARPPNDIWCIFGLTLKMLYLARPSLAKTYAW